MRSFQIPKTIPPIALAATRAYIQTSGKTEAAPQGCVRQGIPGWDSNGQLPEGGFGLPLFHLILSGSAPSYLQNPRGLGWKTPVLITFYPQILRKSHFFEAVSFRLRHRSPARSSHHRYPPATDSVVDRRPRRPWIRVHDSRHI